MEKFIISRDGLPPISFLGECIGTGSNHSHQGPRQNRWTVVKIYKTKGGHYVAYVHYFTCYEGESDTRRAVASATAGELIDWLRDDNAGTLGTVSQEAVEAAVKVDPKFSEAWVETVE